MEEQPGFSVDKMEMQELRAITLTDRAVHPFPHDIYPYAGVVKMGLGVRSQEMAMARADLAHDLSWAGKRVAKRSLEIHPALLHQSIICA